MSRPATPYEAEHERKLRNEDWDAPHRFETPIPTAVEIAAIVRGLPNILDAADLIEQYAKTVASGARVEGVAEAYRHVDEVLTAGGR